MKNLTHSLHPTIRGSTNCYVEASKLKWASISEATCPRCKHLSTSYFPMTALEDGRKITKRGWIKIKRYVRTGKM